MKVRLLWLGVLAASMTMAYGQTVGTPPATPERSPMVAGAAAAKGDLRLVDAARNQDPQKVRTLLNQHVDVNVRAEDGSTALLWAAHWNDVETADLLIRAGANVNIANDFRVTPLSMACTNGSAPLADRLLKAGANPNTPVATGETPITDRVKKLQQRLGPTDNRKVDDYLTSVRDVERRLQKAEEQNAQEVPDVARPAGIPDGFEAHARLMYDLQLLAYQSDLTRVITFMYGREQTARPYPQIGVPEPHHALTHHQNDPVKMDKCTVIQRYHIKLFAEYLEKLRSTGDGEGSLLDHSIILFGGGISNSDRHTHGPLPTLLAGGGAGTLKGGRHLIYPEHTPLTNLQLTLLNKMGVAAEKIGDSTGQFKELSELSSASA